MASRQPNLTYFSPPNLTYFSPKVEKRKSAIDGRGLYAKHAIEAGEVVVVKGGYPHQNPA